jgi:hypothetical protein
MVTGPMSWPWIHTAGATYAIVMLVIDWFSRHDERRALPIPWMPVRWAIYALTLWFVMKNLSNPAEFIYFQF